MERGVRTVQRWHEKWHLPVHQMHPGSRRSPVFAYQEELDRWIDRHVRQSVTGVGKKQVAKVKEIEPELLKIRTQLAFRRAKRQERRIAAGFEQTEQNRFTFMRIDLDAALTLAKIAESTSDSRKRTRNEANARQALDTVVQLYHQSNLRGDQRNLIKKKIKEVRTALQRLGSRGRT